MSRKLVRVGPVTHKPSWNWVGNHLVDSLRDTYDVETFNKSDTPKGDIIICIKHIAQDWHGKMISMPIDQIDIDKTDWAPFLKKCNFIISHSEMLKEHILNINPKCTTINHHGKYTLGNRVPYREEGYAIWIGGMQHVPWLLKWVESYGSILPIQICTDIKDKAAYNAAHKLAKKIGLPLTISEKAINGISAIEWSEANQRVAMTNAKAAIDIKGEDWSQLSKPPTKTQKFVASGLPIALNCGSPGWRYLEKLGLQACEPNDNRWGSLEYYNDIQDASRIVRKETSFEYVRDQIIEILESI